MTSALLAASTCSLALACALSRVFPGLRAHSRVGVLLAILVCLHLPISGITLLSVLRGALGDPSPVTLVILTALFFGKKSETTAKSRRFQGMLVFLGWLFLFSSFGFSPIDVYAWGYQAKVLPLLAGGLALLAWFFGARTLALALLLGMTGWRLHWLDSQNLWDYLLDAPLLAGCAIHQVSRIRLRTSA